MTDYLRGWRDRHGPDDDPFDDESLEPFHVADVAILYHEYKRLIRLEQKIIDALGPPTKLRWNRRKGKFEEE
jgi:hypothetical protein